jgi:cytoskeleton protein RodZ
LEPQNEGGERGITAGEWLSQTRSQLGFTPQQAAERLNLDVWVVEALEANRFSALGPPVYAKGHLRKYATLLGLSADEVIARYERLNDTPTVQDPIPVTVATPIRGVRSEPSKWPRVIAGLVIAALLAAIAVALFKYNRRSVGTDRDDAPAQLSLSEPSATNSELSGVRPSDASAVTPAEVAAVPPAATPRAGTLERTQAREADANVAGVSANGTGVSVRLIFSDTSWTEVYDASGKRLMFDNGIAGRSRTLSGEGPLRVTVGLASGVMLEVNGKPAVTPRRPGRESARFTVGADGTVSED